MCVWLLGVALAHESHLTVRVTDHPQEAKLRNQGRKRGERFSALPLAKQSPDHPVLHGVSQ